MYVRTCRLYFSFILRLIYLSIGKNLSELMTVHCRWNPSYLPAITQLADWYIVRKLLCQEINITCSHRLQVCMMLWIYHVEIIVIFVYAYTITRSSDSRDNPQHPVYFPQYRCNPQVNSPSDVCSNSYYLYRPRT